MAWTPQGLTNECTDSVQNSGSSIKSIYLLVFLFHYICLKLGTEPEDFLMFLAVLYTNLALKTIAHDAFLISRIELDVLDHNTHLKMGID